MKYGILALLCLFVFACTKTENPSKPECPVYVAENLGSKHGLLHQKWQFLFYTDGGPFQYAPCIFQQNSAAPEIWLNFSLDSNMVYPAGFSRLQYDYNFKCGPKSLSGTYTLTEKDELELNIYPLQTMDYIEGITPFHSELVKRSSMVTSYRLQHNILQLTYPGGYMQFAAR